MKAANKRWTEPEESFVKQNLGKLTFDQMGRVLLAQSPYCRIASQAQYPYGDVEDKVPPPRRLHSNESLLHGNRNKSASILGFILW